MKGMNYILKGIGNFMDEIYHSQFEIMTKNEDVYNILVNKLSDNRVYCIVHLNGQRISLKSNIEIDYKYLCDFLDNIQSYKPRKSNKKMFTSWIKKFNKMLMNNYLLVAMALIGSIGFYLFILLYLTILGG